MLAATSQVCPKGLVAFETLKAVHSKIVGLPVKEKKFFKTREAVDYLSIKTTPLRIFQSISFLLAGSSVRLH